MPLARLFGARGKVEYGRMPVNSSASFKKGQYLTVNANNELVLAVAAGSRVGALSGLQNMIVGQAIEDSHDENGTVKTAASFIKAQPGCQFEMCLHHATAASAVPTPVGQLRTAYELINVNTAGGIFAVSLDNTTNTKLKIVDFNMEDLPTWPDSYATGTTQYARVWVEFLVAQSLLAGQA